MDTGELIYITSRLVLGAAVSFLAIMVWSKTRDIAWMLLVAGTITFYADIVYSILDRFGIRGGTIFIGSMPLMTLILANLPIIFFLAAFLIMVIKKYRHHK
jgi:predicted PurR-regulated permease PerM